VSLDEGDNDPVRFLFYVVGAIRTVGGEGFGEGVLAALRSAEPPSCTGGYSSGAARCTAPA